MQTLAERIERDGPVNELDAVGWAIRLAKRLEALHALGVFHGSVSPACVVTEAAERGTRGRLADVRTTTTNVAFQSPERALGGDLSAADDTWAVAAVLYTLLTGSGPFTGSSDDETRQKTLAAAPAPLAVFDVGDDDLQHVLDAAFARDPQSRITTVVTLRKRLEEWHPDPKVKNLEPLDDDEEVSTSEDDERTMLRPAPVFPPRINLGPPKPADRGPRAAAKPSASTPRAAEVAIRAPVGPASAPRGSSPNPPPVAPAAASSRGSGRGRQPAPNVGAFDFSDPATPLVTTQDMPIHASAPQPARIPLPAPSRPEPETPEQAPPSSLLQPPEPSPSVARANLLPDPTDDDEEVKTVMREFPSNVADAARAAIAGLSGGAPASGAFAPRAIGGAAMDPPRLARPAAGRAPLNMTAPMPVAPAPAVAPMNAMFGPGGAAAPRPQPAMNVPPDPLRGPATGGDTLEDDDASDLQATVMREMPALPPEVSQRIDLAIARSQLQQVAQHQQQQQQRPLWSEGAQPGPPMGMHGTGSMSSVSAPPPSSAHAGTTTASMQAQSMTNTPPSHPIPVNPATQAMNAWNSGNTAPIQPVPPLPGVNAPPLSSLTGSPDPLRGPASFGQAPFSDPNPASRASFPAPTSGMLPSSTPPGGQTAALPPGQWVPPQSQLAPPVDNRIGSDPFGQRSRGVTVAAVFALLAAAAVTFAVVRYLL